MHMQLEGPRRYSLYEALSSHDPFCACSLKSDRQIKLLSTKIHPADS